MGAEAIAAAVVGLALLWLVIQPVVLPAPAQVYVDDPLDAEETPRGRALLALKEIEFDRATGKLSDEDFEMLHGRYSALAVKALDATDDPVARGGSDAIEAMIAARAATIDDGARFCTQCGAALIAGGAYCAQCGAPRQAQ